MVCLGIWYHQLIVSILIILQYESSFVLSSSSHPWHQPCTNQRVANFKRSPLQAASSLSDVNTWGSSISSSSSSSKRTLIYDNRLTSHLWNLRLQILELLIDVQNTMFRYVSDSRIRPAFVQTMDSHSLPGMPLLTSSQIESLGDPLKIDTTVPILYKILSTLAAFIDAVVESELGTYGRRFVASQSMWRNMISLENKVYLPLCHLYMMMTDFNIPIPQVHVNLDYYGFERITDRLTRFQRDYIVLNGTRSTLLSLKVVFQLMITELEKE